MGVLSKLLILGFGGIATAGVGYVIWALLRDTEREELKDKVKKVPTAKGSSLLMQILEEISLELISTLISISKECKRLTDNSQDKNYLELQKSEMMMGIEQNTGAVIKNICAKRNLTMEEFSKMTESDEYFVLFVILISDYNDWKDIYETVKLDTSNGRVPNFHFRIPEIVTPKLFLKVYRRILVQNLYIYNTHILLKNNGKGVSDVEFSEVVQEVEPERAGKRDQICKNAGLDLGAEETNYANQMMKALYTFKAESDEFASESEVLNNYYRIYLKKVKIRDADTKILTDSSDPYEMNEEGIDELWKSMIKIADERSNISKKDLLAILEELTLEYYPVLNNFANILRGLKAKNYPPEHLEGVSVQIQGRLQQTIMQIDTAICARHNLTNEDLDKAIEKYHNEPEIQAQDALYQEALTKVLLGEDPEMSFNLLENFTPPLYIQIYCHHLSVVVHMLYKSILDNYPNETVLNNTMINRAMSSVDTLSVRMAILEKYGIEIVPPHDAVREMAKAMLTYKQKNKDFEKEYEELNIEYKNVLAKLIDGKRTQILEYSPLKMEKNQIPQFWKKLQEESEWKTIEDKKEEIPEQKPDSFVHISATEEAD